MDQKNSKRLVLATSGSIAGIGVYSAVLAVTERHVESVWPFAAFIVSAIVAIITIISFTVDSKAQLSFYLTLSLISYWVTGLGYVVLIDYRSVKDIQLLKAFGLRREHLALATVMAILSVASAVFHFMANQM